jgi:hypothetical protein
VQKQKIKEQHFEKSKRKVILLAERDHQKWMRGKCRGI